MNLPKKFNMNIGNIHISSETIPIEPPRPSVEFKHIGEQRFGLSFNNPDINKFLGEPITQENMSRLFHALNNSIDNYGREHNIQFRHPTNFNSYLNNSNTDHVAHEPGQNYFSVVTDDVNIDPGLNAWISDFSINSNRVEVIYQIADIRVNGLLDGIPQEFTLDRISECCGGGTWSQTNNISNIFKKNLQVMIRSRSEYGHLKSINKSEIKALDTLREMISEKDFRKYLIYGFINVQGLSGSIYQIFRNKDHTKVWKNGKLIEELCICIADHNIPKTDKVIALKTMLEANENEVRNMSNVYNMRKVA